MLCCLCYISGKEIGVFNFGERRTPFFFIKFQKTYIKNIYLVFNIEYDSGVKRYKEEYIINYNAYREIVQSRANTEGKELRTISYTLQDLVEKLL